MKNSGPVLVMALTTYHAFHLSPVPFGPVQAVPLPYPEVMHVHGLEAQRDPQLWDGTRARGPSYVLKVEPAQIQIVGLAPTLRLAA